MRLRRVFRLLQRLAKNDVDRALGSHDGNFTRGISQIDVASQMLTRHDHVAPAVRFARDDGYLRHGRLRVRVEYLRAVANDAVIFLSRAGQKARDINKGYHGNIEAIAKSNEARGFHRSVDVQTAG